jgi:hypothetical protein
MKNKLEIHNDGINVYATLLVNSHITGKTNGFINGISKNINIKRKNVLQQCIRIIAQFWA